jgi:hypothetical protein
MTGVVTAVVMATATVYSASEQRKARKDQEKANRIQQKSNKLQAAKSSVEQIRQAQMARSDVVAQGENQLGGTTSSAIAGSTGSITSQAGSNVNFAQQLFSYQQSQARLMASASRHMGKAEVGQAVGAIAGIAGKAKAA